MDFIKGLDKFAVELATYVDAKAEATFAASPAERLGAQELLTAVEQSGVPVAGILEDVDVI